MKKQYLFFSLFVILMTLLILPRLILAVISSPNVAPMKIDVIKETNEGKEENSVQLNQTQTAPTATSAGSVKAEVKSALTKIEETNIIMPALFGSTEKIEECINNSKTIDDRKIWSECRNTYSQDNENEELITKLESCVISYKKVDNSVDNEMVWLKCKMAVSGEISTVVSAIGSGGMINSQLELSQEVKTNTGEVVEEKVINLQPEQLTQTVVLVVSNELKPALETIVANNKNEMVKRVEINGSDIKISYVQPVKLFGFIPIKTNLEVTANIQNKNVEGKTPWWLFLASSNTRQIKNQIQAEVNNQTTILATTVSQQAVQSVNIVNNIFKLFSSLMK